MNRKEWIIKLVKKEERKEKKRESSKSKERVMINIQESGHVAEKKKKTNQDGAVYKYIYNSNNNTIS